VDLARALERANLPALVPVLFQLTGDRRWLGEPYRPTRSRGMDNNDSGGFTAEVAGELRAAVLDAVLAYEAGTPAAVPAPTGALLRELLSLANGEPAPADYTEMLAEDLGFVPGEPPVAPVGTDLDAIIIGAGVSGLLAALKLREAGISAVVLEKNGEVGGTWWENTYPGAGVDTPSHLYSYSFFPRDWSTHFGKRDEVQQYLQDFADAHTLRPLIRFHTEVTAARWDERTARWTVHTAAGEVFAARALISATGVLNRPKVPPIPGLDTFTGEIFHTAQWPAGVDLTGKRVAVVGVGASAMQVVPAIAEQVGHLTVYQRSRQWVAPSDVYFTPFEAD
jgi:4-hydroxyacetophenone monooxygenase